MEQHLINEREWKQSELSEREAELARLEQELNTLQDRDTQAGRIESAIAAQYAERLKKYPICREQELEIVRTITEKSNAIDKAFAQREDATECAEKQCWDRKGKLAHPHEPLRFLYGYDKLGRSAYAEAMRKYRAAKRDYDAWWKAAEKERDSAYKEADKLCVNELKRLFGELEVDIKRFYKSGISKDNLNRLTDVMNRICTKGTEIGTIPVSYQQKVYKWRQTAADIPEDEEKKDREKEEAAREAEIKKLDAAKDDHTEILQKLVLLRQEYTANQSRLKDMTVELSDTEGQRQKKEIAAATCENRKAALKASFESTERKLKDACERRKTEIQENTERLQSEIADAQDKLDRLKHKRIAFKGQKIKEAYECRKEELQEGIRKIQSELADEQVELSQLKNAKSDAEEQLNRLSLFSIGKKKELKKKINETEHTISQLCDRIWERQERLGVLAKESPEADMDSVIRAGDPDEEALNRLFASSPGKKEELHRKLSEMDESISQTIDEIRRRRGWLNELARENPDTELKNALHAEKVKLEAALKSEDSELRMRLAGFDREFRSLQARFEGLQRSTRATEDDILRLEQSEKVKAQKVSQLEQNIASFHAYYLVSTYGQEFGITEAVKNKKIEVHAASQEAKKLRSELTALDKELAKQEKELARQRDAEQRALIEKAKEEERIRQEQQERQKRIQKELLAREKEQEELSAGPNLLKAVEAIVQELEKMPDHHLLRENLRPLADDGRRIIVNSIVRKQYTQTQKTPDCARYVLLFADQNGNAVSEQRLIEQKAVGEKTMTSFELKAADGFHDGNYYLLFLNFDTGSIICAEKYKVSISFANDFGF